MKQYTEKKVNNMDSEIKRNIILDHYQNPRNKGLTGDNDYLKMPYSFNVQKLLSKEEKYSTGLPFFPH